MWAEQSVFYQIYPLGFCGAPRENDGVQASRVGKIGDWAKHIEKLGADAVYLSPIFESDRHGYDTRDYRKLDCRLGTNKDFAKVCKTLHKHGVKVVLDGVFNHVGRGFWAFQDVREKKWDSPYKDWFHISFDGNSNYNDGFWYEGWEGHFELVKLNLRNPAVVDYLVDTVKFSALLAVAIMLVGLVVIQLFPADILGLFEASADMLAIGVPALRIISLCFVFAGFSIICSSTFQALGNGLLSMMISIVRQLLILLPAAFFLSLSGSVTAVWWAFPIAELASLALCVIFLCRIYRRVILPLE